MAELKIAAAAENLDAVIAFVEEQMHLAGLPGADDRPGRHGRGGDIREHRDLRLSARHGRGGGKLHRAGEPPSVTVRFADSGRPYDPLRRADPDITLSAEERAVGGLGILMVKKLMDETAYEYVDGKNVLTIKKYA